MAKLDNMTATEKWQKLRLAIEGSIRLHGLDGVLKLGSIIEIMDAMDGKND
jgi:hypothetical protein